MVCNFFKKKKLWHRCFPVSVPKVLKRPICRTCLNGCLSEMNHKNCIHKIYSQENTSDGVLFSVVADMWAYNFSKKGLHHRCFCMRIGKFYRTSILQNNAARLLLISCDIFSVLLVLSVVYHFSQSMEILCH